jgi:N-acetylmuramoyl-L-alanine amidase
MSAEPTPVDQAAIDLDTMARTLWAEARGEGREGMEAVAAVIMNRYAKPCWWSRQKGDGIPDDTIQAVCRDPWQFSCWNRNDPNLPKLLAVDIRDPAFRLALDVAAEAMSGQLQDPTGGAHHYKVTKLAWPKDWGPERAEADYVCGAHSFYRGIP